MRTILILSFLFVFVNVKSQDTLYLKNGNFIAAKVIEIGTQEIKYKKVQNPDGPMYVINKADVAMIEYASGYKDIFGQEQGDIASNKGNKTNPPVVERGNRSVTIIVPPVLRIGRIFRPWCRPWWAW